MVMISNEIITMVHEMSQVCIIAQRTRAYRYAAMLNLLVALTPLR